MFKSKSHSHSLILLMMLGAPAALAGGKTGINVNARPISWDELQARCANPENFDIQRAPQSINIQCTDVHHEYVADAPGSVPLPESRLVTTAIFADKFYVNAEQKEVPVFTKGGSCFRFKEVEKSLTIEKPMSCAEVLGLKGSVDEYCVSLLDAIKGSNPKLAEVRDTGRVIDTCAGVGGDNVKGGPK